ncbi:flagellin [Nocardioides hankookensis]|uniref:Flagellin n=1 Tax=Nocardioides hankookensis TaxID=443157 RepID=A0ABW1LH46_9ACTN
MSLRINQNIDALNSYRNLSVTQGQMSKSLEKLSSGYRINRAADDAAGLAISEGLRSQVGGIKVATRNAQDGVSVVQTAEGALTETHSILQRMRDLAVQSGNDSNDQTSRDAINSESKALTKELDRIAQKTTFNNINLLDGTFKNKDFQVGYASGDTIKVDVVSTTAVGATTTFDTGAGAVATAATATFAVGGVSVTTGALTASTNTTDIADQLNNDANFASTFSANVNEDGDLVVRAKDNSLTGTITSTGGLVSASNSTAAAATSGTGGFDAATLLGGTVDLSSKVGATAAITKIDGAIKAVSTSRANLGALQNRFEHTINNLSVTQENLSASESRIRDTDMASEMMSFTRSQILSQAGTAMLSQANQAPQGVLSLLR